MEKTFSVPVTLQRAVLVRTLSLFGMSCDKFLYQTRFTRRPTPARVSGITHLIVVSLHSPMVTTLPFFQQGLPLRWTSPRGTRCTVYAASRSSAISVWMARQIASGSSDGCVYFYSYKSSELLRKIKAFDQACIDVAFHPLIPDIVASCSWTGEISVFG
ncbi:unnamed protein product [Musa textilis]